MLRNNSHTAGGVETLHYLCFDLSLLDWSVNADRIAQNATEMHMDCNQNAAAHEMHMSRTSNSRAQTPPEPKPPAAWQQHPEYN